MNRHEKFMADCAARMETLQGIHERLHAVLPEHVREHGTEALPDPTWDDFIDAHPELTDAV